LLFQLDNLARPSVQFLMALTLRRYSASRYPGYNYSNSLPFAISIES
jgi:hypothetical protein